MSTEKEEKKKEKKEKKVKSRGMMALTRLIAVLIVILLALGAYHFGYSIFNGRPVADSDEEADTCVITVQEGDGVQRIAEELKEEGMIRSVLIMRIQDRIFDYGLAPGSFEVNSGMTSLQILSWISDSNHTLADLPAAEEETVPETQTQPETETETGDAAEDVAAGAEGA